MELDSLPVNESISVLFLAPDSSRCSINLTTEEAVDVPLHFDMRYNWGNGWINTLVMNTLSNGNFGTRQSPSGFDFTPRILVKVTFVAGDDGFRIFSNDKFMTTYLYRDGLTSDKVRNISWSFDDRAAPADAVGAVFIEFQSSSISPQARWSQIISIFIFAYVLAVV